MIKIIYQSKQSGQKKSSLYKRFSTIYLNYNSCLIKFHFFRMYEKVVLKFFLQFFENFIVLHFLVLFSQPDTYDVLLH